MTEHPMHLVKLENGVHVYLQPGGCLEIGEEQGEEETDDLVHICSDQIDRLLDAINYVRMEHERCTVADGNTVSTPISTPEQTSL